MIFQRGTGEADPPFTITHGGVEHGLIFPFKIRIGNWTVNHKTKAAEVDFMLWTRGRLRFDGIVPMNQKHCGRAVDVIKRTMLYLEKRGEVSSWEHNLIVMEAIGFLA